MPGLFEDLDELGLSQLSTLAILDGQNPDLGVAVSESAHTILVPLR